MPRSIWRACILSLLFAGGLVPPPDAAAAPPFVPPPGVAESLVTAGRYYSGPAFGPQDYAAHANVAVGAYYIMKTEVTYDLYRAVGQWAVGHGYQLGDICNDCDGDGPDGVRYPVAAVSWGAAVIWANALSEMGGLSPYYRDADDRPLRDARNIINIEPGKTGDGRGYRLPAVAEWQIAARGAAAGLANKTYGEPHAGSADINKTAWHAGKSNGGGPTAAGRFAPNALGIFDMSGNLSEWTDTPAMDMAEAGERKYFYYCGESWNMSDGLNTAYCDFHSAGFSEGDIGFRLVRSK